MGIRRRLRARRAQLDRHGLFYTMLIITSLVIFVLLLGAAIGVSRHLEMENLKANLREQTKYVEDLIDKDIDVLGKQVAFLGRDRRLLQLAEGGGTSALKMQVAQDIKETLGNLNEFVGVSLQGKQGFIPNPALSTMDRLVAERVAPETMDFSKQDYAITFAEYDDAAVMIVTTPVREGQAAPEGYLSVVFDTRFIDVLPANQEIDALVLDTVTWMPVMTKNYQGNAAANAEIRASEHLIEETAKHLWDDIMYEYTNGRGEQMVAYCTGSQQYPCVNVLSRSRADLNALVFDYSKWHLLVYSVSILLLGAVMFILYNRTRRPVQDLIDQCQRIADDESSQALVVDSDKDLRVLAETIDRYRQRVEHAVYEEPRLGVGNYARAVRELRKLLTSGKHFSVFVIDIVNFRKYNSLFSERMADRILVKVSARLKEIFGRELCHLGGDVFMGVNTSVEGNDGIIQEVLRVMNAGVEIDATTFYLKVRIGVADMVDDDQRLTAEMLLRRARAALVEAKRLGGEPVVYYNEALSRRHIREQTILFLLRECIAEGDMETVYQPVYGVAEGEWVAAEALPCLRDKRGEPISPQETIRVARKHNLMEAVGEMLLRNACRMKKRLKEAGSTMGVMSLNLSVQQFMEKDYARKVLTVIDEEGLDPREIYIEVAAGMLSKSFDTAAVILSQLRGAGVGITMDDFGSGGSEMDYFQRVPVDALKFNSRILADAAQSARGRAVLKALVDLVKVIGSQAAAQDVTTREVYTICVDCGVNYIQGPFFSEPLSSEALVAFVNDAAHKKKL